MGKASVLLLFAVVGWAQTLRAPDARQSLSFQSPGAVRLSPDGKLVAYTVSETDWDDNEYKTQVWVARADGSERFQLTRGKKSAASPEWSPAGDWLAFTTSRDGKNQVWLVSPRGGEAWALTADEGGVQGYRWSPDGRKIAFTSQGAEPKEAKERKDKFGEFEVVEQDARYAHLYVAELPAEAGAKAKVEQLTKGESFNVNAFSWSPDGARIAFSAGVPNVEDSSDIYVVAVADKAVKKVVSTPGPDSAPEWSPDGAWIAYSTANAERFHYFKNDRLAAVPSAGGEPRVLTQNFDEEPRLIQWSEEGIWFGAAQKTSNVVFLLDPKQGTYRRMFGDDRFAVTGVSFSKDRHTVALGGSAFNAFTEVYVSAAAPFQPRAITDFNAQYKEFQLGNREVISWKSKDGAEIEGVLVKPANFEPGRKYTLLVVIHGGPTGVDRPFRGPDWAYPIEQFVAKGALVLRPNYRGSAGYGEKFRSLNVRNLGVGDMWDVMSGVDHLIAQGMVDPARMGAMGWSQGGYISAFLTTNTDRFKAISVGAGISDWMTYYVNTDIHPFTRQYLQATPWDDPAVYARTSPITNIKQARTPTLIQHGENDKRVPLPNAYELYQGLRDQGVEARLVVYKGFGHGINKPKQGQHVLEDNLRWFTRWIWGEK
ncbi:MAG: S9 family peptidase [Candidatus Solibacter usitatus]|nr:S9 family peptidase [Candidatus Solibacter usitatus]